MAEAERRVREYLAKIGRLGVSPTDVSSQGRQRNLGFRRAPRRGIFTRNYDRPKSLGPAAFYHERRLDYPFD